MHSKNIKAELDGDILTITGKRITPHPEKGMCVYTVVEEGVETPIYGPVTETEEFTCKLTLPPRHDDEIVEAHFDDHQTLNIHIINARIRNIRHQALLREGRVPPSDGHPVPIDFVRQHPDTVRLHGIQRRPMLVDDNIAVAKDGTLLKGGVRYRSVYTAAPLAKTSPTTLRDWIKKGRLLNGQPLESYYFAPSDTHFISENSICIAADRFIKWPSGEKAGDVTIGETTDRSGFIGLPAARAILGISNRTMYLWATERKAPHGQPLDIIKDPMSEHLFIRERDVYALKKVVPKRGLPLGRRPQAEPSVT